MYLLVVTTLPAMLAFDLAIAERCCLCMSKKELPSVTTEVKKCEGTADCSNFAMPVFLKKMLKVYKMIVTPVPVPSTRVHMRVSRHVLWLSFGCKSVFRAESALWLPQLQSRWCRW